MKKDKNKSIERLQKAVAEIPHLKTLSRDLTEFNKWKRDTTVALKHIFGNKSAHLNEFIEIYKQHLIVSNSNSQNIEIEQHRWYVDSLERAEAILDSMIGEIKEYWENEEDTDEEIDIADFLKNISKQKFPFKISEPEEHLRLATELINDGLLDGSPMIDGQGIPVLAMITGMTIKGREYIKNANQKSESVKSSVDNKKVFIVHGHDNEVKEVVKRFIERIKLTPIILHEQPSKGMSILEKFEHNADVGFAIVLLTPDDRGVAKRALDYEKDRARQNVIFEMGYFIGKLRKHRVCAITKGEVEIPSDYSGVLYIKYGGEDWKNNLFKELREAGFDINAEDMI